MSKSTVYYFKRHKVGMTRSEMANALEVDYDRYELWEKGVLDMPSKYIDKFNEIIHRTKKDHNIDRLKHEREVNEWWEEMRQKDDRGVYKLNEVAKQYNFKTTRDLSEKLGFHKNSISFFLSSGNVSYDKKDRMYTFLHNELNIQPPLKKKGYTYKVNGERKELLEWYNNFDLKHFLLEHDLKQADILRSTSIASGTISALVNRKFDTPTTMVLSQLKDYVDKVENGEEIEEIDSTVEENDIIEETVEDEETNIDDIEEEIIDDYKNIKPVEQLRETTSNEMIQEYSQIQKAIARVEVLLAKAKADVLVYEDILKDLKGE